TRVRRLLCDDDGGREKKSNEKLHRRISETGRNGAVESRAVGSITSEEVLLFGLEERARAAAIAGRAARSARRAAAAAGPLDARMFLGPDGIAMAVDRVHGRVHALFPR